MDVSWTYCNHFTIYVTQVTKLYSLNLYNAVYQLHLNKTGKKRKSWPSQHHAPSNNRQIYQFKGLSPLCQCRTMPKGHPRSISGCQVSGGEEDE